MRKTLASVVVIVFAGLLCTSLLTVFSGGAVNKQLQQQQSNYPYIMTY